MQATNYVRFASFNRFSSALSKGTSHKFRKLHTRAIITAGLEPSSVLAVSQQAIAYIAVVGGEAAYTGITKEKPQGKPALIPTVAGTGAILTAVLLSQIEAVQTVGFAVGLLATGAMMAIYAQRFKDTEYDALDWPGAKSWPAVMCLISFFAFSAFGQALRESLG